MITSRARRLLLAGAPILLLCAGNACRSGTVTRPGTVPATASLTRLPRDAARFEIESVVDSTARFRPFEARVLRIGMTVLAVDPAQRDALVARLRIVRSDSGRMVALVTSQMAPVTSQHVLLAVRPAVPWYKMWRTWGAMAAGAVVGAGVAQASK